jgi:hypothetical protein
MVQQKILDRRRVLCCRKALTSGDDCHVYGMSLIPYLFF